MPVLVCPDCRLSLRFEPEGLDLPYCPRCLGGADRFVEMCRPDGLLAAPARSGGESADPRSDRAAPVGSAERPAPLRFVVGQLGETVFVAVGGPIDARTAGQLDAELRRAAAMTDGLVVLDVDTAAFQDGSGADVLLDAARRLGPRLKLLAPPAHGGTDVGDGRA